MRNKKAVMWIVLFIVIIIAFVLFSINGEIEPEDILKIAPENIFAAAVVIIGIFTLKNVFVVIPLVALYIACGLLFGAVWGIVVAYIGLACEISIGFMIGKKLGKERIESLIEKRPKAGAFFGMLTDNPKTSCFIDRLIPLPIPVDLVSMFFGASEIPFGSHLLFSLLGLTSGMLPYVIAGKSITNPLSAEFIVPVVVGITISVFVFVINRKMQNRREKKTGQGGAK